MKVFFVCFFIFGLATGAGLDLTQHPQLNIYASVLDAKKLEARAVAILRKDGLTLEEARVETRPGGVINNAVCTDVVLRYAIRTASPYLSIDEVQVVLQH